MRRNRREFSAFSLSFLDIMSCGFGAVVLLFLIIKHQVDVAVALPEYDLSVEVETLREQIAEIDLNPVIVGESGCSIVDALVVPSRPK